MPTPVAVTKFGSLGTRWSPEKVPAGFSIAVRNCAFTGDEVHPRPGLTNAFIGPDPTASISGFGYLQLSDGTILPLGFDSAANFFKEDPPGSGAVVPIPATFGFLPNLFMDMAPAYHRAYVATSDLITPSPGADGRLPRVYYKDGVTGEFKLELVGMNPNALQAGAAGQAASAGDVQSGVRYVAVLFRTGTGYTSGFSLDSIQQTDIATEGLNKIFVTGIPLGPEGTVARVLAFTPAGVSSQGPYYIIEADDNVDGLNAPITSTIINDNTTTDGEFNFTDEYLQAETDVSDFPDKIQLVPQKSVFYSKTLRRLIWAGEDQDTFRVSEVDDPETYFGTTGFMKPGEGDGGTAIRAIEWRTETYLAKTNGGHVIADTTLTPAEWKTTQRWADNGPMGPWAIDASDTFMSWAHRSGVYIYEGEAPIWVSMEISGNPDATVSWDRVNWKYAHLIYVTIDTDTKVLRVGVPMDQSTVVNQEFVCDYSMGWTPGKRRWSINDIAACRALRIARDLPESPNPGSPVASILATSQMLFLMNSNKGQIMFEDVTSATDDGGGFNQEFQVAFTPPMTIPGQYELVAVSIKASGAGSIAASAYPMRRKERRLRDVSLDDNVQDHMRPTSGLSDQWSIKLSNNGDTDTYFNLHRITLWVQRMWDAPIV